MFIKVENGKAIGSPFTLTTLLNEVKNVSFPLPVTTEMIAPYGYAVYEETVKLDDKDHFVVFEDEPELINEVFKQKWSYREMTENELQEETKIKADKVRFERNKLLFECDWTQLLDCVLDDEMKTKWILYRQQLRDISNQAGFPWNVTFPSVPTKDPAFMNISKV